MIQYNWVISAMDSVPKENNLTDVVKIVHWRRCAKQIDAQNEYNAEIYDAQIFNAPDELNFIPYNELTFEEVCGWLEKTIDLNFIDSQLDLKIQEQINPPIIQLPLPWNNNNII